MGTVESAERLSIYMNMIFNIFAIEIPNYEVMNITALCRSLKDIKRLYIVALSEIPR